MIHAIFKLNESYEYTLRQFAKACNANKSDPRFIKVIKYLTKTGVVSIDRKIGQVNIYKIYYRKFKRLVFYEMPSRTRDLWSDAAYEHNSGVING